MLVLCFLPPREPGELFCFPKLWLLYFFAAVALCCPTHLHCSHEKTSFWRLSIEFRQLFSTFSVRTDPPALVISYRSKGKKTEMLQANAANSTRARALLEFLCFFSVAQVSQRHQPQISEQSGRGAPEDAVLPVFSGDLAGSHLLCSFGAWFS